VLGHFQVPPSYPVLIAGQRRDHPVQRTGDTVRIAGRGRYQPVADPILRILTIPVVITLQIHHRQRHRIETHLVMTIQTLTVFKIQWVTAMTTTIYFHAILFTSTDTFNPCDPLLRMIPFIGAISA
jgi:hypothetical protein